MNINGNRIGMHYFPDTKHYSNRDLKKWLPELQKMGISWLTLIAPHSRCIPENFIKEMISAKIQPILHFHLPFNHGIDPQDLGLLFKTYARWGIKLGVFFDRPNLRTSWPIAAWSQNDLVERFIDCYLPIAESALKNGLTPVFPPLEPGGDYWDTAFLRASLRSLKRRGSPELCKALVVSAYGWSGNRPIDWGIGGPERWPTVRPYFTPPNEQDQRGFRIFDWYAPLAAAELDVPCPVILLGAGARIGDHNDPDLPAIDPQLHCEQNLAIAQLLLDESSEGENTISEYLLASNFWLLSSEPTNPHSKQAWYRNEEPWLPIVGALTEEIKKYKSEKYSSTLNPDPQCPEKPIIHYLLLPEKEDDVNWHMEMIQPFVNLHQPTIGFSLDEARLAQRITVVGNTDSFSDEVLNDLRQSGSIVNRIDGDGTEIASRLAGL